MMKRGLIFVLILTLLISALCGCGKEKETDYYMHGYEAIEHGLYKDALYYFDLAAKRGDEQSKKVYDIVDTYLKAREAMDKGDAQTAATLIDGMSEDYKYYAISEDVDRLKQQIDAQQSIDQALAEIYVLIQEASYDEAQAKLSVLEGADLTEAQKKTVRSYKLDLKEAAFTPEIAASYIQQVFDVTGDISGGMIASHDQNGEKFFEITIQDGQGDDATIRTVHVYVDGTIKQIR